MTEKSWPWSTVAGLGDGAAELNEANSREFLALYFGIHDSTVEGVSKGVMNELEVSGVVSPLEVKSGSAICYGLYISDDSENLAVATPASGTTGGRVVLQTNWAGTGGALEATTRLAIIMNTDGNPAPPALTQAYGTTWEISLATFTIDTGGSIHVTDDRTFRRSTMVVDTDEIIDEAITTAKIEDDAVIAAKIPADTIDDTHLGNRAPQFYRRQGGSATAWADAGSTNRTPGYVRMQAGVRAYQMSSGQVGVAIAFPVAFSDTPIIIGTLRAVGSDQTRAFFMLTYVNANNFQGWIYADDKANTWDGYDVYLNWLAIGPE